MKIKQFTMASTLLACMLSASFANAQDNDQGLYLGAGFSRAGLQASDLDSAETQASIAAGYMFTNNLGAELSITNLDGFEDDGLSGDLSTYALSGIYSFPASDRIDVYGKLGVARTVLEIKDGSQTLADESETDVIWGVGGKVDFGAHNVVLEYNKLSPNDGDLELLMLGYRYEFH